MELDTEIFEDTPEGTRRGILFAITIAAGFISIVAATSSVVANVAWWTPSALLILGIISILLGILIARGRLDFLVSDDQFFWSFNR